MKQRSLALTVAAVGSLWGLAEVSLGGLLHAVHFAQKGAVMGGIAVALMACFAAATGRPALVPLLGVIAASFKPMAAMLFALPALSPPVSWPAPCRAGLTLTEERA